MYTINSLIEMIMPKNVKSRRNSWTI